MRNSDERGTELVFRRQGTSYTGKDIQSPRGWFTADFSVHDDKAIECLNKIFFGQTNREPRHGSVYRAAEYLHTSHQLVDDFSPRTGSNDSLKRPKKMLFRHSGRSFPH